MARFVGIPRLVGKDVVGVLPVVFEVFTAVGAQTPLPVEGRLSGFH
jgi:hypothetical protein